jgi:hypothetical protein
MAELKAVAWRFPPVLVDALDVLAAERGWSRNRAAVEILGLHLGIGAGELPAVEPSASVPPDEDPEPMFFHRSKLAEIDRRRGDKSRGEWVRTAVEEILGAGPKAYTTTDPLPLELSKALNRYATEHSLGYAEAIEFAVCCLLGVKPPPGPEPQGAWYRPTSAEAKRGVEVDPKLLEDALTRGRRR